jgi:hypothetical protein
MIFLVLVMLLWTSAARQLACQLRVDKAIQIQREQATNSRRAMAWALSLLETGDPPTSGGNWSTWRMDVDGEIYVTTFTQRTAKKYHIEVRPRQYPSDDFWPLAPESFGEDEEG